jgi:hypothetical protein
VCVLASFIGIWQGVPGPSSCAGNRNIAGAVQAPETLVQRSVYAVCFKLSGYCLAHGACSACPGQFLWLLLFFVAVYAAWCSQRQRQTTLGVPTPCAQRFGTALPFTSRRSGCCLVSFEGHAVGMTVCLVLTPEACLESVAQTFIKSSLGSEAWAPSRLPAQLYHATLCPQLGCRFSQLARIGCQTVHV